MYTYMYMCIYARIFTVHVTFQCFAMAKVVGVHWIRPAMTAETMSHVYHCHLHVHVHVCQSSTISPLTDFVFRQKVTISKLQQDVHESEAKLQHLMVAQVHEHGGSALEARLQVHIHTCTWCSYTYRLQCNSSKTKRAALGRIQTHVTLYTRQILLPTEPQSRVHVHVGPNHNTNWGSSKKLCTVARNCISIYVCVYTFSVHQQQWW